jgi:hypothetical protein
MLVLDVMLVATTKSLKVVALERTDKTLALLRVFNLVFLIAKLC